MSNPLSGGFLHIIIRVVSVVTVHFFHKIFFTLLLLCGSLAVRAQHVSSDYPDSDTTVWFVNVYPGSVFYELEGHSAIRIKTGEFDIAVNYGMFNFDDPNFLYRFVKGETDYMVGAYPWSSFENEYRGAGRRIVAHRLNMTGEQKSKLIDLIVENLRPENRVYRYNYVLDNCATRPLRMVELAIGDTLLVSNPVHIPVKKSFRDYMRYYHENYSWYQFGIDLALGKGIDREITAREMTFAPVTLDDQIGEITIGLNSQNNLVSESEVWNDVSPSNMVEPPTPFLLSPCFIFWLIACLCGIYGFFKVYRYRRYPKIVATVTYGVYGLAGLLIAFLVFISVHESTSPNINILWLNPLCLIPAITLWIRRAKRFNCWYFLFNFVMLLALYVLWIAGYQSPNPAFLPMTLIDMELTVLYLYLNSKNSE